MSFADNPETPTWLNDRWPWKYWTKYQGALF